MTNFNDKYEQFTDPEDDYEECNEYEDYDEDAEDDEDEEYRVGYRKPPKHTQFQKGKSGNPKGRPKTPRNPAESLARELSQLVEYKDRGEIKKAKAMDLIARKTVALALQGNVSIIKKFLENSIIDPLLFKSALNNYNPDPQKARKTLSPELKELVNMLKKGLAKTCKENAEKRKRGEIE